MPGLPSARRAPKESILKRVKKAEEINQETYLIKALLVGPSGSGKSTSACTIPGRTLVVDLDDRSESLVGLPNVEIIKISEPDIDSPKAFAECLFLKDELWALARSDEGLPWNTVLIDGYTRLGRYAMYEALQLTGAKGVPLARAPGGGPAQPHYAPQMGFVVNFSLQLLPLPCNVVFTAHADIYEDKVLNTIHMYPKITGKTRTEVSSWFNETYLCEYSPKEKGYFWHTKPFGRYDFLKSSLNRQGKFWEEDIKVDLDENPCGFAKLLELRFKGGTNA